jgi:hypothetical protein
MRRPRSSSALGLGGGRGAGGPPDASCQMVTCMWAGKFLLLACRRPRPARQLLKLGWRHCYKRCRALRAWHHPATCCLPLQVALAVQKLYGCHPGATADAADAAHATVGWAVGDTEASSECECKRAANPGAPSLRCCCCKRVRRDERVGRRHCSSPAIIKQGLADNRPAAVRRGGGGRRGPPLSRALTQQAQMHATAKSSPQSVASPAMHG